MRCRVPKGFLRFILPALLPATVLAGPRAPVPVAPPELIRDLLAGKTDVLAPLQQEGIDALPCLRAIARELTDRPSDDARTRQNALEQVRKTIEVIQRRARREIPKLVSELGAEHSKQRRRARKRLLLIGAPALDALREAAQSPDPEIRLAARELVLNLENGRWRQPLIQYLKKHHAIPPAPDDIRPICPNLAQRLCPDYRFFNVRRQDEDQHYWVDPQGKVGLIALSTGGDLTAMFGGAAPVIRTEADAKAFFRLVGNLRYGFSPADIAAAAVSRTGPQTWTGRIAHRLFTATVDANNRLTKLHMR